MSTNFPDILSSGTEGKYSFFVLDTHDVLLANMLSRSINSEIETYAVKYVSFDVNHSSRHDEILALRFGQCPIDNSKLDLDENNEMSVSFDISGPIDLKTSHIPDMPFAQDVPIISLRKNERISATLIVGAGKAKDHVKWRPVGCLGVTHVDEGYKFRYKNKGIIRDDEIIDRGLKGMVAAATRDPITIFSRPVVPSSLLSSISSSSSLSN